MQGRNIALRLIIFSVTGFVTLLLLIISNPADINTVAFARECADDGVGICRSNEIQNSFRSVQDQQTIIKLAQRFTYDNGPAVVYFSDYGHFVPNPLLHYWRSNGSFTRFGGPISESFLDEKGNVVQFFQKMALAYSPSTSTRPSNIYLYPIGSIYLSLQPDFLKSEAPFAQVPALSPTIKNQKYFPQTGHKISFGMLDYFNSTGGQNVWGLPISEEFSITDTNGKTFIAQLFEQGRMLWSKETGVITDPNFLIEVAKASQVNLEAQKNIDIRTGKAIFANYSSSLWSHWVDVDLTNQSETFFEGDVPVRTSLVTTGTVKHPTPTGNWHIFRLVANEHMKNGKPGDPDYYDLKNVLYTMYFTYDGDALHYAWWREQFGEVGSHGCVNEDLDTSLFAWNFLGIGSLVKVHY